MAVAVYPATLRPLSKRLSEVDSERVQARGNGRTSGCRTVEAEDRRIVLGRGDGGYQGARIPDAAGVDGGQAHDRYTEDEAGGQAQANGKAPAVERVSIAVLPEVRVASVHVSSTQS